MNKKSRLSRRDFMKGSAALAGTVVLGSMPMHLSANPRSAAAIKVALVGCGGRGTGAAVQALSVAQDVQLVAMADAFKDRLDSSYNNIMKEANVKRVAIPDSRKFVGLDAYKKAIDECDVAILTTPPGFRPVHLEYAIQKNKHVFTEKPLATDSPGIRKVLEIAELSKKKKLNVVVGLQRHYQVVYRELIKRIHDGMIGDITAGQVYWNGSGVWVNPRQSGQSELEYQLRNWYYFNWLCGDHIVEQHIHNIDVMNWVKGAYPAKAQGMGGRQVRTGKEYGEIYDHHYVEFTYADGSIMNSQCRHIPGCMERVSESFTGTKGRADSSGTIYDLKGNILWKHRDKDDPNPYQVEHDELFAAISKGEFINDLENGAKSTMTAIMGRMATYSGQELSWDEALNSDIKLAPDALTWASDAPIKPDANGFYTIAVPGVTKVI
ncbi:MAG TPA: Gfo/Idh/MocA family oxidoreductase [Cyclobacteriaceae bacterium]|nr:Gfo/Idh/MocA family oxidoreductase [Cyclobacteriaceae bacterium]